MQALTQKIMLLALAIALACGTGSVLAGTLHGERRVGMASIPGMDWIGREFESVQEDGNSHLKLELASVVFRHGDRSPENTFPTDPYEESDWPQGYGQLSIVGMQQQQHLAELLKARYVGNACEGLVCANYTRVQVRVRSTDVDRTLMSAGAHLSTLFPPDASQTFDPNLPWQPIPIHTAPSDDDKLLKPYHNCPRYDQLQQESEQSPEYQQINEENAEFFAELSLYTGMHVDLDNLWQVYDAIYIEHVSPGYTVPSWATPQVRRHMDSTAVYTFNMMFDSHEKRRIRAGNWMGKVNQDMKNKANPGDNQAYKDMKLFLYSAHDTTVATMLSGLDVYDQKKPCYASAFAVELYSDAQKNYYVKMFRRYGPYLDRFVPLKAPYCKNPTLCTLDEFDAYVTPMVPTDLEAECQAIVNDSEQEDRKSGDSVLDVVHHKLREAAALLSQMSQ